MIYLSLSHHPKYLSHQALSIHYQLLFNIFLVLHIRSQAAKCSLSVLLSQSYQQGCKLCSKIVKIVFFWCSFSLRFSILVVFFLFICVSLYNFFQGLFTPLKKLLAFLSLIKFDKSWHPHPGLADCALRPASRQPQARVHQAGQGAGRGAAAFYGGPCRPRQALLCAAPVPQRRRRHWTVRLSAGRSSTIRLSTPRSFVHFFVFAQIEKIRCRVVNISELYYK